MAAVAGFQVLFWLVRSAVTPGGVPHGSIRVTILAVATSFVLFSYTRICARRVRAADVLCAMLVILLHAWLGTANGLSLDYALPPRIIFFVVCAIATSSGESDGPGEEHRSNVRVPVRHEAASADLARPSGSRLTLLGWPEVVRSIRILDALRYRYLRNHYHPEHQLWHSSDCACAVASDAQREPLLLRSPITTGNMPMGG